jgi:S-adenosylmethionine/arginine decarboxylase-like enzyme
MTWGYHLLLDCSNCLNERITDREVIADFVYVVIEAIEMQAHGPLYIEYLLPGTDNEGYSVMQMITTSNITAHFVTKSNTAYIDVFSCKDFDVEIVKNLVSSYFDPEVIQITHVKRQA